jgi:hypothetical protein
MSIEVRWLETVENVRLWKFGNTWTWVELYENITPETTAEVENLERVDVIFDFTDTKTFPQNFLSNLRMASKHKTENLGIVVIIATPFVQALLSSFHLLNTAMIKHYAFASTIEESLELIRRHRAKSKANSA